MNDFSEADKIKCLLWCDRHCCLCDKPCGVDIELHHIEPRRKSGSFDIDNAIPLCYDCHSKIEHYSDKHPRGTKYRSEELKSRRDQIYDRYTWHLVPAIEFGPSQELPIGMFTLPSIGFSITHRGNSNPIQALVEVKATLADHKIELPDAIGHYSGRKTWNLNPLYTIMGFFSMPDIATQSNETLKIDIEVTIIDRYSRHHKLLPNRWIFMREHNRWYLEP